MNQFVSKLFEIGKKQQRYIIGLMSGTSLDGLDIALCRFTGSGLSTKVELVQFETIPYQNDFKDEVKSIFSKRQVNLEKVCLLNGWVAAEHAKMILQCLKKWKVKPAEVDLIASHGQTIYHAPKTLHHLEKFGNATLQIGDGDQLAMRTGIITLSDFRQKHVAAGGEGAPLAVYGDYLVFSSPQENRIMLNIGGIANFTYLPSSLDATAVFSTDTGTGNAMMDQYIQANFPGKHYDENASIASQGTVIQPLLQSLINHPFFEAGFPKTIGPELFNLSYLETALSNAGVASISHEDALATLSAFSAITIADALKRTMNKQENFTVYVSGGGMHNPLLMQNIQSLLPNLIFKNTAELGVDPDAKEAVLFAILANECVHGGKTGPSNMEQGIPSVSMGKISFPG
jgi:anhydro-N-acetylmuramic acid kinase